MYQKKTKMKRKDLTKFRQQDPQQLRTEVENLTAKLLKSKVDGLGGEQKNKKEAKNTRKDIAQLFTLMREKQIIQQTKSKSK